MSIMNRFLKGSILSSFLSTLLLVTAPFALADDSAPAEAPAAKSADPWEGFNRSVFRFNMKADKYLLKPFAKAYVRITPNFFRRGVSNAMSNVLELPSALNGVLQGNLRGAAHDTGRLLVNSTIGLAGLLDVAQYMGLHSRDSEDFGQTLAVWGVKSGPYVVLPILGPSTLRDAFATPVDWYSDPKTYIDHVPTRNTVRTLSVLDTRASLMPLEKSITGDKYVFMRDVYLQHREFVVKNGQVEDSFGEDEPEDSSNP